MAYGAASCGAEFIEDMPEADVFIILWEGVVDRRNGGCNKHFNPAIKVIGVEPQGANSLRRSFLSGRPNLLIKFKQLQTVLGRHQHLESFQLARANVDQVIEIEDKVMSHTMLQMRDRLNLFVEPACAASLGAALAPCVRKLQASGLVF